MTRTLNAPVFEIRQDSDWYAKETEWKERQNKFFEKMDEEYSLGDNFAYYYEEHFGIIRGTEEYERFKTELRKHPDENGVHIFKKNSKYFPIFRDMIKEIGYRDSFRAHDEFGLNNVTGKQWIGDRWFFGVKDENIVQSKVVEPVEYKEYLSIVQNALEEETNV